MSRYLFPIFLVLLSGGMYIIYIGPTYAMIQENRKNTTEVNNALTSAPEVIATQTALLEQYQQFNTDNRAKLDVMLPTSIDETRLIFDVNTVAARYNLLLKGVTVGDVKKDAEGEAVGGPQLKTKSVKFGVRTTYQVVKLFLRDLEKSLALRDVTSLSFGGTSDQTLGDNAIFDYTIEMQTYSYQ